MGLLLSCSPLHGENNSPQSTFYTDRFIRRSQDGTEKQPAIRTLSTRRRFAARETHRMSQIFPIIGKVLSSPQLNFYWQISPRMLLKMGIFSRRPDHVQNTFFRRTCLRFWKWTQGLGPGSNFSRPRVVQSTKKPSRNASCCCCSLDITVLPVKVINPSNAPNFHVKTN